MQRGGGGGGGGGAGAALARDEISASRPLLLMPVLLLVAPLASSPLSMLVTVCISAAPEVLVLDSADVSIVSASAALGTAHVSSDGRVGSDGSRGSTSGRKHA